MMKPVVTEPATTGEVKQEPKQEPKETTDPEEPKPEPTVAIATAVQTDDGAVTVSGTSGNIPEGTTVTVTLADTVTATTTTDSTGAWTVMIPTAEAATLPAGTVTITVTAIEATDSDSFEYMPPEPEPIVIPEPVSEFYMHEGGISNTETEYRGVVPDQGDFAGYVLAPKVNKEEGTVGRRFSQPIEGVTVTIVSGPRAGESTITDQNGQYFFRNMQADELHLRVEREYFELKEVIVHRDRPTMLANGDTPNYRGDPQQNPGNILIGQRWPERVRFLLEREMLVFDPLFFIADLGEKRYNGAIRQGGYSQGSIMLNEVLYRSDSSPDAVLALAAHEIAHMRQHALVSPDGSGDIRDWAHTLEGVAFAEARQKDWDEVGKSKLDLNFYSPTLIENSAEFCAYYWTRDRMSWRFYGDLEVTAPNRYKWAEEWLNKRY